MQTKMRVVLVSWAHGVDRIEEVDAPLAKDHRIMEPAAVAVPTQRCGGNGEQR